MSNDVDFYKSCLNYIHVLIVQGQWVDDFHTYYNSKRSKDVDFCQGCLNYIHVLIVQGLMIMIYTTIHHDGDYLIF
jgi:hypothetical protein